MRRVRGEKGRRTRKGRRGKREEGRLKEREGRVKEDGERDVWGRWRRSSSLFFKDFFPFVWSDDT